MIKVKLKPVLMMLPAEGTDGDYDIEVQDSLFQLMQQAVRTLEQVSDACNESVTRPPVPYPPGFWSKGGDGKLELGAMPPAYSKVSQVDPPINTAVSDREMRSSGPEMTLAELREPPERTRTPPRPRANSWRHNDG